MLMRRMNINNENYRNKQSEAKKICTAIKKTMVLRCWKVWRKQIK